MAATIPSSPIPPEVVMEGFHVFLSNALAQAKLERLIEEETLASAEADVMIAGPALCLYFAALRSNTTPPSVPIPRAGRPGQPLVLSSDTCPEPFRGFFRLWSQTVPQIQALESAQQHTLAKIICEQDLPEGEATPQLNRIAADLRSVAIEISQRRTFQARYQADLQSALDAGQTITNPDKRKVATFRPPPSYEEASPASSVHNSPQVVPGALPGSPRQRQWDPPSSPPPSAGLPLVTRDGWLAAPGPASVASSSSSRSSSPTFAGPDTPAIVLIRETLYAALADVIATTPSMKAMLKGDPARAYFSAVALAILGVATTSIRADGTVVGVLGNNLTLDSCPPSYRPLMKELGGIAMQAKKFEVEDDDRAIRAVSRGMNPAEPRMDRLRRILEHGVAHEELGPPAFSPVASPSLPPRSGGPLNASAPPPPSPPASQRNSHEVRRSLDGAVRNVLRRPHSANPTPPSTAPPTRTSFERPARAPSPPLPPIPQDPDASRRRSEEGTTVQFANRINALALKMTELRMFKERSDIVFKILSGVE